jgi:hypothetical protein
MQRCVDRFGIVAAAHGDGIDVEDMRKPAASRAARGHVLGLCAIFAM